MELHNRLKNSSKQLTKCWRLIHKNKYSEETNQECLCWLKEIYKIIENLESNLLGLEHSLKGEKMSDEKKAEFECHQASEEMLKRWMPLIIYGEMSNLNLR